MSHVTGPISTLPGTDHELPEGTVCDEHSDRLAVHRVQGETDSFGAELNDLCQECFEEMRQQGNPAGRCDWCGLESDKLRCARDFDEGLHGPVYLVCRPCQRKQLADLVDELDEG